MSTACDCVGEDPARAWDASHSQHVRTVTNDVHRGVDVTACRRCGQRFAVLFEERVSYSGGADDQTWQVVAISDAEASTDDLAHVFAGRRKLVRVAGAGVWWR
jgi:hypothetical protein